MPLKKITDEKLKTVGLSNIDAVHSLEMTPKTGSKRKSMFLFWVNISANTTIVYLKVF